MSVFPQFDLSKQPKNKIELHVHLDGSIRISTLWEVAVKKGIKLGVNSFNELLEFCIMKQPSNLATFLEPIFLACAVFCDDLDGIERIAYEFCEDSAKQGILYSEVRYCPQLFCSSLLKNGNNYLDTNSLSQKDSVSPKSVVQSVNRGLARGQKDFNIKVRSILSCIRGESSWSKEILDLCLEFRNEGIVGIDIAGLEMTGVGTQQDIDVFQKAAKLGIHRTVHAGEAGPGVNVEAAVRDMMAERIGHGYHVLEDELIYKQCLQQDIHFEVCPYSSFLTGAVPLSCLKHLVVRLAEDNANFSINRDDTLVIQKTFDDEYTLLKQLGLSEVHFVRANFNAVKSCFLPDDEKKTLFKELQKVYGMYEPEYKDFNNL